MLRGRKRREGGAFADETNACHKRLKVAGMATAANAALAFRRMSMNAASGRSALRMGRWGWGTWGRVALAGGMAVGLGLWLLALAGFFHKKIELGLLEAPARPVGDRQVVQVAEIRRPRVETAVGTVRPVLETAVASRLLAKVIEVRVAAGQPVQEGEVLVRLEDRELVARQQQAAAALAAAESAYQRAEADFRRAQQLQQQRAIAQAEYERDEAAFRAAAAEVERARQALREAEVLVDYATIRAPRTGIVVEKRVSVGDTAVPGQVLLTLYDPTKMQLVATVRESLAQRLAVGQTLRARLETLAHDCEGTISEIVPEAEAASRSFTVKVVGPCPPGVYSGMFGRIEIPLDEETLLVVPAKAVLQVGQLDMVDLVVDGALLRRSVRLGRRLDEGYEVLAGLKANDRVALPRREQESEG
jgi:RND family efflux transporter MFP subunit